MFQHISDHLRPKNKNRKLWIFPKISKSQKSPLRGKFFIFHFFAKIFREGTFQHISDHLRPKNENRKFEIFSKISKSQKSPLRGKFFIFHFFAKIFRESTFQHISDHLSPKNKNRKFWRHYDVIMTSYDTSKFFNLVYYNLLKYTNRTNH